MSMGHRIGKSADPVKNYAENGSYAQNVDEGAIFCYSSKSPAKGLNNLTRFSRDGRMVAFRWRGTRRYGRNASRTAVS